METSTQHIQRNDLDHLAGGDQSAVLGLDDEGVGFVFLPHSDAAREEVRSVFEGIVREEGQHLLGWRNVPTGYSLSATLFLKIRTASLSFSGSVCLM